MVTRKTATVIEITALFFFVLSAIASVFASSVPFAAGFSLLTYATLFFVKHDLIEPFIKK